MFDLPSLRIGRIFGIPIEVNLTWLIIFGLVAFTLAAGYFPKQPEAADAPAWLFGVVGIISALLFFASIVLHELGHSIVARSQGIPIRGITLFMLGGVSQLEDEPSTAGREFVMAIAGPAVSLVLAAICFAAGSVLLQARAPWWLWAPLGYLAIVNLLVGVFNLLPGFPLDGGRVLRAIIWGATGDLLKSTKWAARIGQIIGWTMVIGTIASIILTQSVQYIWFGLIGWFIAYMAAASYRQLLMKSKLAEFPISSAMTPNPEFVHGELTLEELAHEHFLGGRHSRYPVILNGEIVGIVTLPMIKDVPREQWESVHVADVTDKALPELVIESSATVDATLPRFAEDRPGALLVTENGRMVGIITRSDVIDLLSRIGPLR